MVTRCGLRDHRALDIKKYPRNVKNIIMTPPIAALDRLSLHFIAGSGGQLCYHRPMDMRFSDIVTTTAAVSASIAVLAGVVLLGAGIATYLASDTAAGGAAAVTGAVTAATGWATLVKFQVWALLDPQAWTPYPVIHGGVSGWWSVVAIAVVAYSMRAIYRLIERGGHPQALRAV